MVGHRSKLQNSPSPSSGEAELNAATKGKSEVLGIRHFLEQVGVTVRMRHFIDASAAKGTLLRKGAGKIKHLEVRQLWGQYAVEKYGTVVIKIPRRVNLADTLIHPVGRRHWTSFHDSVNVELRP